MGDRSAPPPLSGGTRSLAQAPDVARSGKADVTEPVRVADAAIPEDDDSNPDPRVLFARQLNAALLEPRLMDQLPWVNDKRGSPNHALLWPRYIEPPVDARPVTATLVGELAHRKSYRRSFAAAALARIKADDDEVVTAICQEITDHLEGEPGPSLWTG